MTSTRFFRRFFIVFAVLVLNTAIFGQMSIHHINDAWDYGHPRKATVDNLIENTSGSRPLAHVYAMDAAKGKAVPFDILKAVYCTCWDGNIVIHADIDGVMMVETNE